MRIGPRKHIHRIKKQHPSHKAVIDNLASPLGPERVARQRRNISSARRLLPIDGFCITRMRSMVEQYINNLIHRRAVRWAIARAQETQIKDGKHLLGDQWIVNTLIHGFFQRLLLPKMLPCPLRQILVSPTIVSFSSRGEL